MKTLKPVDRLLTSTARRIKCGAFCFTLVCAATASTSAVGSGLDATKSYLVHTVERMKAASADFVKNANAYAGFVAEHGGNPAKAYAADKAGATKLVDAMRENYKTMDSFGYETVEGIIAGVPAMAHYDISLDAGVPKSAGPDNVAPVQLKLRNGDVIDQEGSLFTYIIEPALWGGNPKWVEKVDLDGDGKIEAREALPRPEVLVAAAAEVDATIGHLLSDAQGWKPTTDDCFGAMTAMVPTLSGYFEDWKESRYADETSGRFFAVSRVSDMRGIMKSCAIMYDAVHSDVKSRDKALAGSIKNGFAGILAFVDKIEQREKQAGGKIKPAEIDEMAAQAKSKTDKLVPQIEQAAALVKKAV